jgi:hypothetical protein
VEGSEHSRTHQAEVLIVGRSESQEVGDDERNPLPLLQGWKVGEDQVRMSLHREVALEAGAGETRISQDRKDTSAAG